MIRQEGSLWARSSCRIKFRRVGLIKQLVQIQIWLRFMDRKVLRRMEKIKKTRSFSKVDWYTQIGRIKDRWQHQEWEQCWHSSPIWLQTWVTHTRRQERIMQTAIKIEIKVKEWTIKAWWTHNWHNIPPSGLEPTTKAMEAQLRWWLTCASTDHLANSRNMRSQATRQSHLVVTAKMETCSAISTALLSR